MELTFEWNYRKAASNQRKHGIAFEEATSVFNDPLAVIFDDEEHSTEQEIREITIGHSARNHLLVLCFTERTENVIRLISARRATRKERVDYEENV
jgi:uncharacterized DUF497 family protein